MRKSRWRRYKGFVSKMENQERNESHEKWKKPVNWKRKQFMEEK